MIFLRIAITSFCVFASLPQIYLNIGDTQSAVKAAQKIYAENPNDSAFTSLISCLAASKDEKKLLETWEQYRHLHKEPLALEELAWGLIFCHENGTALPLKYLSAYVAARSEDARARILLSRMLESKDTIQKSLAAQFAIFHKDSELLKLLVNLLETEQSLDFRLNLIDLLGQTQFEEALPVLQKRLQITGLAPQEQRALAKAIIEIAPKEAKELREERLKSKDLADKFLCLESFLKEGALPNEVFALFAKDPHNTLRAHALFTGALFARPLEQFPQFRTVFEEAVADRDVDCSLIARWALSHETGSSLQPFCDPRNPEIYSQTLIALGTLGGPSHTLLEKGLAEKDLFIAANAAIAGLEFLPKDRVVAVLGALLDSTEYIEYSQEHAFSYFRKASKGSRSQKELSTHLSHWQILTWLSTIDLEASQKHLEHKLARLSLDANIEALFPLLEYGDASLVEKLLLSQNLNEDARLQALTIYSVMTKEPHAFDTLFGLYPSLPQQKKFWLLEILALQGDPYCTDFFEAQILDQSPTIRLLASLGALKSLNG